MDAGEDAGPFDPKLFSREIVRSNHDRVSIEKAAEHAFTIASRCTRCVTVLGMETLHWRFDHGLPPNLLPVFTIEAEEDSLFCFRDGRSQEDPAFAHDGRCMSFARYLRSPAYAVGGRPPCREFCFLRSSVSPWTSPLRPICSHRCRDEDQESAGDSQDQH